MPRPRVATATPSALAAAAIALMLALAPAANATTPDPAAGWHGRAITQPRHDHQPPAGAPLRGWSAGPVRLGTGRGHAHGSQRVREVQTRLRRLGYRPGPVDGLYGPRTQAATAWFQIKHGLPATGIATLTTVRHLRARTRPRPSASTERSTTATPRIRPAEPTPTAGEPRDTFTWWPWLLAALAIAAATAALVARRQPEPSRVTRPQPRALGYLRTPYTDSYHALDAHVTALERECRARGLALEGVVTDELDERRARDRPGLKHALQQLRTHQLDCLVVSRLEQLTDRQVELHDTLQRISRHGAVLVVLNTGPHHEPPPRKPRRPRATEAAHA